MMTRKNLIKIILSAALLLSFLSGCSHSSGLNSGSTATSFTPLLTSSPTPSKSVFVQKPSPIPSHTSVTTLSPTDERQAKPDSAVVIFTFDDGAVSDYLLAFPILKQYDIKGTSYIVTKFEDRKTPVKLTWAQIKEMSDYGWVFGGHTYDHHRLTEKSDEQIKENCEEVSRSFIKQGLQPPQVMAYPYGAFNQNVIDDIKPYYKQARLDNNNNIFVNLKKVNAYEIPSINADMQTQNKLEKVEGIVDSACEQGAVAVFRIHALYKINPYDTVADDPHIASGCAPETDSRLFAQLVKYCVDKGCKFITMTDLMDLYS